MSLVQRITGYMLVALVWVASTGFVINRHFCQNELKSVAVFVEARPCHVPDAGKVCPMHAGNPSAIHGQKKNCCDDRSEFVRSETDQIHVANSIDMSDVPEWAPAVFIPQIISQPNNDYRSVHYLNHKPPLIVCDLSLRLQTLLC